MLANIFEEAGCYCNSYVYYEYGSVFAIALCRLGFFEMAIFQLWSARQQEILREHFFLQAQRKVLTSPEAECSKGVAQRLPLVHFFEPVRDRKTSSTFRTHIHGAAVL